MPLHPSTPAEALAEALQIDRAGRVAGMLDRWEVENVGDEPDWEVSDVDRSRSHGADVNLERR